MAKSISPADPSSEPQISPIHSFFSGTSRRILIRRPIFPESISPAPILGPGPLHFFRLTYDPRVVNRIRALRKAAEEDRNHDLEHGLFMEERKAQRGLSFGQPLEALKTGSWRNWPRNTAQLIANFPWIIVMGLYWALADYGRSFVRPFLCWLVLSLVIFPWWYSQILPVPLHMSFLDAYNMSKRFNWLRAPMLCLSSVRSR
ncbi:MAG: hypothetical protein USCAAHI_02710 [Beijerinckiaceae bacterium]|nr:MAG: hypothetical protein USCAAHI_02710 [Beijerinckiaceae bacterium]